MMGMGMFESFGVAERAGRNRAEPAIDLCARAVPCLTPWSNLVSQNRGAARRARGELAG